ncbi:capping complex subunit for YIEGIA [Sediminibacillus massiliensis]|uniref:capping complex subunit for YIEGIA n=1 Tax=Sediminibacillus massiliensis TaxID=1926277 RepID=UPI000988408F
MEKAVLAVITTKQEKVAGGAPIFLCDSQEEMEKVAANLEAILDGISHALSDQLHIIVKH